VPPLRSKPRRRAPLACLVLVGCARGARRCHAMLSA